LIVANDIRHIKPIPGRTPADKPLTGRVLYWLAWVLPLLALAGDYTYTQWERVQRQQADAIRSSRAGRKARKALQKARKEGRETSLQAGQILTTYLVEKLNQPVSGLTHSALDDLLDSRGISPDLRAAVIEFLQQRDLGRFSPARAAQDTRGLFDQLQNLVDALEKTFHTGQPSAQRGKR
jgi:hypothetical protein